ncbi:MAG: hypothetical protein RR483_03450, partial [Clostridia bacterium]
MNTADDYFQKIYSTSLENFIMFCFEQRFFKRTMNCNKCNIGCKLVTFNRAIDGYAWRCMNKKCNKYKAYYSIRVGSFFNSFK